MGELRIATRALLLIAIATVRGVYTCLEQPGSSTMKFLPPFRLIAKGVTEHLGLWKEQFLSYTQSMLQWAIDLLPMINS